jgi:hypothetical protein
MESLFVFCFCFCWHHKESQQNSGSDKELVDCLKTQWNLEGGVIV